VKEEQVDRICFASSWIEMSVHLQAPPGYQSGKKFLLPVLVMDNTHKRSKRYHQEKKNTPSDYRTPALNSKDSFTKEIVINVTGERMKLLKKKQCPWKRIYIKKKMCSSNFESGQKF
jgi:mRNA-degrading endonuclease HigB of HigAB toxin-antitoxin module